MSISPELVFPGDGEMAALMRETRWEATSLGDLACWPGGLRAAVRIVLTSPFPMWMVWGDDLAFLYNDRYRTDALGAQHPQALGTPARGLWHEIWPDLGPRIAGVLRGGRATRDDARMRMLERSGYREETYHTSSYGPLHDDDGHVRGVLCVPIDETGRLLSERRVGLLGGLASETAGAKTNEDFLAGLERSLAGESRDLPFTLTYLFDATGTAARLASHTGFPADRAVGSPALVVDGDAPWRLRELLETGRPVEIALDAGWPTGPWAASPTRALVVPIGRPGQARLAGAFVAGLNPHRTFDAPYRAFVTLLVGQVAAGLANAGAHAAERRRAESLAALACENADVMPERDGLGLIAALRADPELRDLPVIMVSAHAGDQARIEGLHAGATGCPGTPFAAGEHLARVETELLRAAVRSTEALHARRLATIFEQAPVAMVLLRGPEHVFEIVNPLCRKIIGDRDVIGRPLAQALPEVVPQGFLALLDRVFRTGEPLVGHAVPIHLQRTEGGPLEELTFDLSYQPLVDFAGQVTGIAVIGHDVTALARARRDAETANRTKDEFLAMLGHELRNPLAPIMTALELMRLRPGLGAERERAVIERQVHHLVGLVDDLLDISRITRGKVELRAEPVELADVVARSIELVSPLLEEHRHDLTVDVAPGLVVNGDPARLAQIVSNLLTNAAKYTPAGGRIAVTAVRDAARAVLKVIDNGVGMEPTMLRAIFEPFAQECQSNDRARGGLGLGLAIVDNLVKLHGGVVAARSEGRGHGSELSVRLPLIDSPVAFRALAGERTGAASGDARILIIDDNVDAALLLAELLAAGGYRTLAAHDGPSALQAAGVFQPQIAVVDLGLPVMDGFELARHLLARSEPPATKLVALTGYGQAQDRARTAAAGFAAHLVKPVDMDQLRKVIEQLLPRAL